MSGISFGETKNINDLHNELRQLNNMVANLIKDKRDSYQISFGYVLAHDDEYNKYTLTIPDKGIKVTDAILLLEPAYYDLVGYPEIGDLVRILHQESLNVYILGRCNSPTKEMVGNNSCGIPSGVYMP